MSDNPPRKYPIKTAAGVGLLLLWLFRSKGGLGTGKGKPLGLAKLGLIPQDLQRMLSFENGLPTDTVRIILTPDGLSKLPQGPGQAIQLEDITRHALWFQPGKLHLDVRIRGDAKEGDAVALRGKIAKSGIGNWSTS